MSQRPAHPASIDSATAERVLAECEYCFSDHPGAKEAVLDAIVSLESGQRLGQLIQRRAELNPESPIASFWKSDRGPAHCKVIEASLAAGSMPTVSGATRREIAEAAISSALSTAEFRQPRVFPGGEESGE